MQRIEQAEYAGITRLTIVQRHGSITIHPTTDPKPRVVLEADDIDEVGKRLVRVTFVSLGLEASRIHVPDETVTRVVRGNGASVSGSVFNAGPGTFIAGNNYGSIQVSAGRTFINGVEVTGSEPGGETTRGVDTVVYLPAGSSVRVETSTADTDVTGTQEVFLDTVEFRGQSADLEVAHAGRVDADTQWGDVNVETASDVRARTQSGDVVAARVGVANVSTMSGEAEVGAAEQADVRTMSGGIKVIAAGVGGGPLRGSASSMSGGVRLSRLPGASISEGFEAHSMSGKVRVS